MEDWEDYRKRRWQEAVEDAIEAGMSNAAAEEHADEVVADLERWRATVERGPRYQ